MSDTGYLRVTQTGSSIGRQGYQELNLKGLGLGKRHRSRVLKDSPEVRGMIARVAHLVTVEEGVAAPASAPASAGQE